MSLTAFSERLRATSNIARFGPTPLDPNLPLVLAVGNQLLISRQSLPEKYAVGWLSEHGYRPKLLTTLLNGLPNWKAVPDVGIWEIEPRPGEDVFSAVQQLRLVPGVDPSQAVPVSNVSPNHVLVPASFAHSCPFGPPAPLPGTPPPIPPPAATQHRVTVIDSGYQWNPAWGPSPLANRLSGPSDIQAERLPKLGELPPNGIGTWKNGTPDVGSWVGTSASESPETTAGGALLALAGHANFIAGVIAQKSPAALITVRNHNGFDPSTDDFPTEATVARSLCLAGLHDRSQVVNVGFAFCAYDSVNADQSQPQISNVWESALEYVDETAGSPVIVAPAGNQGSDAAPLFPAALWTRAGTTPTFANVVGVASIDARPAHPRSSFSNYGDWVTCSAIGSKVHSTFLHVDMPLEDSTTPNAVDFTHNGWAIWNGTSFATPKVVAGICNALTAHPAPRDATAAVLGVPFPLPAPTFAAAAVGDGLGVKLPNL